MKLLNFFKPNLSQADQVRKQWLWALIGLAIVSLFFVNTAQMSTFMSEESVVLTFVLGASIIFNYIFYYCAYQKRGTWLLAFSIVCMPFGIVGLFKNHHLLVALVRLSMLIAFNMLSIRLFFINRQFQQQKAEQLKNN